jgi:hypothetical protein
MLSHHTIQPTTWYFGVYVAVIDCVLIANLFTASVMIAFNLDFLKEFWGIDTAFDFIIFFSMLISIFVKYERDE